MHEQSLSQMYATLMFTRSTGFYWVSTIILLSDNIVGSIILRTNTMI